MRFSSSSDAHLNRLSCRSFDIACQDFRSSYFSFFVCALSLSVCPFFVFFFKILLKQENFSIMSIVSLNSSSAFSPCTTSNWPLGMLSPQSPMESPNWFNFHQQPQQQQQLIYPTFFDWGEHIWTYSCQDTESLGKEMDLDFWSSKHNSPDWKTNSYDDSLDSFGNLSLSDSDTSDDWNTCLSK